MRTAEIIRNTKETSITLSLNLDGSGISNIDTGVGFLDHMLTLFARHGSFDLDVTCQGDTNVDDHHSVEDIGICLGSTFVEGLGNMAGIHRYGNIILPMDESLILCAAEVISDTVFRFRQKRLEPSIQNWSKNFSWLSPAKPE